MGKRSAIGRRPAGGARPAPDSGTTTGMGLRSVEAVTPAGVWSRKPGRAPRLAPLPVVIGLLLLLIGSGSAMLGAPGVAAQTGSGAEAAEDPGPLLEEASRRYEDLQGFCAEFDQERIVPLLNQTTRSSGTLCQMRAGYFLMDFSEPDGDRVVADGESLWIYYPSVDPKQVIRTRLGGSAGTFDFHAEFLEDPTGRFDAEYVGRAEVTGRSTHVLALRPRDAAAYEEARVWLEVDRGLIRKVEIAEENESLRRVTLSNIRVEPDLDPGRFAFEPPAEAQVLNRDLPSAPR